MWHERENTGLSPGNHREILDPSKVLHPMSPCSLGSRPVKLPQHSQLVMFVETCSLIWEAAPGSRISELDAREQVGR